MNGEADNSRFVSMHVYMHLAFKELKIITVDIVSAHDCYITGKTRF